MRTPIFNFLVPHVIDSIDILALSPGLVPNYFTEWKVFAKLDDANPFILTEVGTSALAEPVFSTPYAGKILSSQHAPMARRVSVSSLRVELWNTLGNVEKLQDLRVPEIRLNGCTDLTIYSPTWTRTFTATPTFTASPTTSPTPTVTATPTSTGTYTATPTATPSPSPSYTATPSASPTSSGTPTLTGTITFSFSPTLTSTPTGTLTRTSTASPSPTPTITPTATPTSTMVCTGYSYAAAGAFGSAAWDGFTDTDAWGGTSGVDAPGGAVASGNRGSRGWWEMGDLPPVMLPIREVKVTAVWRGNRKAGTSRLALDFSSDGGTHGALNSSQEFLFNNGLTGVFQTDSAVLPQPAGGWTPGRVNSLRIFLENRSNSGLAGQDLVDVDHLYVQVAHSADNCNSPTHTVTPSPTNTPYCPVFTDFALASNGGLASASSQAAQSNLAGAIDGAAVAGDGWKFTGSDGEWLQVSLSHERYVDQVGVVCQSGSPIYPISGFEIQYEEVPGGGNWLTAAVVSNSLPSPASLGDGLLAWSLPVPHVSARNWRLFVQGALGGSNSDHWVNALRLQGCVNFAITTATPSTTPTNSPSSTWTGTSTRTLTSTQTSTATPSMDVSCLPVNYTLDANGGLVASSGFLINGIYDEAGGVFGQAYLPAFSLAEVRQVDTVRFIGKDFGTGGGVTVKDITIERFDEQSQTYVNHLVGPNLPKAKDLGNGVKLVEVAIAPAYARSWRVFVSQFQNSAGFAVASGRLTEVEFIGCGTVPPATHSHSPSPTMTRTSTSSPTSSATPTATGSPTPTASPTATPTLAMHVESACSAALDAIQTQNCGVFTTHIAPWLRLVNDSPVNAPLNGISMRYWLNDDGFEQSGQPLTALLRGEVQIFDSSGAPQDSVPASQVQLAFTAVSQGTATHYLEISFISGTLVPFGRLELALDISNDGGTPTTFNQSNDWSWDGHNFVETWAFVTAYEGLDLKWGVEPGSTPPTATASPTISVTATKTATPTHSATSSVSPSPSFTQSPTPTWTHTLTETDTFTFSATPTVTATGSATPSGTATLSHTPPATYTPAPAPGFACGWVASTSLEFHFGGTDGHTEILENGSVRLRKRAGALGGFQLAGNLPLNMAAPVVWSQGNRIFVGGGYVGPNPNTQIWSADLDGDGNISGGWALRGNLPDVGASAGLARWGDALYYGGGFVPEGLSNRLYVAKIDAAGVPISWNPVNNLHAGEGFLRLIAARGWLYHLASYAGPYSSNLVYRAPIHKDASLGEWSLATSRAVDSTQYAVAEACGTLFTMGGERGDYAGESTVQRATLDDQGLAGAWSILASDSLPAPRSWEGSAEVDAAGKIFVAGGKTGYANILHDDVFSTEVGATGALGGWGTEAQHLPMPLAAGQVLFAGNKLWYLAGHTGFAAVTDIFSAALNPGAVNAQLGVYRGRFDLCSDQSILSIEAVPSEGTPSGAISIRWRAATDAGPAAFGPWTLGASFQNLALPARYVEYELILADQGAGDVAVDEVRLNLGAPPTPGGMGVLRLASKSASKEWLPKGKTLLVAPNPARNQAWVGYRLGSAAKARLQVLGLDGAKVLELPVRELAAGEHVEALDLRGLAPGLYFAVLFADEGWGYKGKQVFKFAVVQP